MFHRRPVEKCVLYQVCCGSFWPTDLMHRNTPPPKALELIPLTTATAHILPSLALLGLLLRVEALRRPRTLEVQQAPDAVAPRVGVQVAALTLGQRGIVLV